MGIDDYVQPAAFFHNPPLAPLVRQYVQAEVPSDGPVVKYTPAEPDHESQSGPLAQLTRAQEKLSARWSERFGPAPMDELRAILRDDLGCNSEEVPRTAAERALVLWVNKNELRMKRDLKTTPSSL